MEGTGFQVRKFNGCGKKSQAWMNLKHVSLSQHVRHCNPSLTYRRTRNYGIRGLKKILDIGLGQDSAVAGTAPAPSVSSSDESG